MRQNRETKSKWFESLFIFWMGRLKFEKPIKVKQDNRLDCICCIEDWHDPKKICMKYNSHKISREPQYLLICDMFHEVGHLVNNLPYSTYEEMVESEYQAELFATKMMKKHYPRQYKQTLAYLTKRQSINKFLTCKEDKIYYDAFVRIKDYRETMR